MFFRGSVNIFFNDLSSLNDLFNKTDFFIIFFIMFFFNPDDLWDHIISFSNLSQGYFIGIFRVLFLHSNLAGNIIDINVWNRDHFLIFISNLPHAIVPVVSVALLVSSKALATLLASVDHPGNKIFYNTLESSRHFNWPKIWFQVLKLFFNKKLAFNNKQYRNANALILRLDTSKNLSWFFTVILWLFNIINN